MWFIISATDLERYLDEGTEIVLVDLRDPDDYAESHIKGAINIYYEELSVRWKELPVDRLIIFYCYRGPKGILAARNMSNAGYRAANVCGGIQAYRGKYRV
ncbi:MAG: rhodanese-like domain-containing protein [Lachnospiraceae bacterium]